MNLSVIVMFIFTAGAESMRAYVCVLYSRVLPCPAEMGNVTHQVEFGAILGFLLNRC